MLRGLAAVGLLLLAGSARARTSYDAFPPGDGVFRQLEADPRSPRLGAAYYRLDGRDRADVMLGHGWGMARWFNGDWTWQWNIEALAYSRFTIGGSLNSFETVDFAGSLPLMARRGPFSARAMLFHESSHLGDDYIRETGDRGFRYSVDGVRATLAVEPVPWARAYCGMTYLLHTIPDPARKAAQGGLELTSPPLREGRYPLRFFAAQDLRFREATGYGPDARTLAGVIVGFDGVPRSMRLYVGHFEGHSSFGQLYKKKERYNDAGISFHF